MNNFFWITKAADHPGNFVCGRYVSLEAKQYEEAAAAINRQIRMREAVANIKAALNSEVKSPLFAEKAPYHRGFIEGRRQAIEEVESMLRESEIQP